MVMNGQYVHYGREKPRLDPTHILLHLQITRETLREWVIYMLIATSKPILTNCRNINYESVPFPISPLHWIFLAHPTPLVFQLVGDGILVPINRSID